MTAPKAIVRVKNVTKKFGDFTALHDVSLTVNPGEQVGLLGPNGAGKSTLISLINGLRRPSSGQLELFGQNPSKPAARDKLGTTPQATGLPEALKVAEVLDFVGAHYPLPKARRESIRNEIIEMFELGPFLKKQCGSLSGGQQRRVAVALAFIGEPSLVLLDEPTTGLDVDGRARLWEAIRSRGEAGCTLIITSHHLEEIEQLADRVVVIDQGRVLADDSLAAVVHSTKRCVITLNGPSTSELLQLDSSITFGDKHDNRHTVYASDSDAFVRKLVRSELPFTDLTVRGASLEEAFLAITKA